MSQSEADLPTRGAPNEITEGSSEEVDTKELNAASEDHPLVQHTGLTGSMARQMDTDTIHEYLADLIYDQNSAVIREYRQNAETACLRASKLLIRKHPDYGPEWLGREIWVNEDGETVAEDDDRQSVLAEHDVESQNLRKIVVPKKHRTIINKARDLGYDPTIEITVNRDERMVIIQDNGIGMTSEEIDKAFNTTGLSGVRNEDDTGGKFGMGALTFANFTGYDGGMEVITRTRRDDAPEYDREGIRFYTYLGGIDPMDADQIPDGFRGTRFEIPVKKDVSISNIQDWVEKYSKFCSVPVLYQEKSSGSRTGLTKEEYGGTDFIEAHDNPPVVIDRPGEFTAIAGPNITTSRSTCKTALVSMPIEKNVVTSIKSLWNAKVQIHGEQGRIISGPNRGEFYDEVDTHSDDIKQPEPTADRDRLQDDSSTKDFIHYINARLKERELEVVADVAEKIEEADHPADVPANDGEDWEVFRKAVEYHGPFKVLERESTFADFVNDRDEFPDFDDETITQLFSLFSEVSHARSSRDTNKSERKDIEVGELLADNPRENIYMAASTSGKFTDRARVVYNTHGKSQSAVIVVDGRAHYSRFEKLGFSYLKNVPKTRSDEHDYDVPKEVHDRNTGSTKGKSEDVDKRIINIHQSNRKQSVDTKKPIGKVRELLEDNDDSEITLFPTHLDENLTDNYELTKWVNIASCSKTEYEALEDLDNVFTYDELMERARNVQIETEFGQVTVDELRDDDYTTLLVFASSGDIEKITNDDPVRERMREMWFKDRKSTVYKTASMNFDERRVAVVNDEQLRKIAPAIAEWGSINMTDLLGLRPGTSPNFSTDIRFKGLDRDASLYYCRAQTPDWDENGVGESLLKGNRAHHRRSILFGLHDAGVDPDEYDPDELRELIGNAEFEGVDDA